MSSSPKLPSIGSKYVFVCDDISTDLFTTGSLYTIKEIRHNFGITTIIFYEYVSITYDKFDGCFINLRDWNIKRLLR